MHLLKLSGLHVVMLYLVINNSQVIAQQCRSSPPESTPTSRFTVHGNGTVTDNKTGLMWKQCIEKFSGQNCTDGFSMEMRWRDTIQQANTTVYAGYDDWRIPNYNELESIIEYQCTEPAMNAEIFQVSNRQSSHWSSIKLWTSSTAGLPRFLSSHTGKLVSGLSPGFPMYFLLVRDGQ
ncbi:MAG: DUF1566 domain-containing protein [Methylococcales bacterium]